MDNFSIERYENCKKSDRTLLFFPHWNSHRLIYKLLMKFFPDFRVVMYWYSSSLLSADINITRSRFEEFEQRVLGDLKVLRGSSRTIDFYGVSLGSVLATRIANVFASNGGSVSHLVLNLSAADFPYAVWNGTATRKIKQDFIDRGIPFEEVHAAWHYLSPIMNLDRLLHSDIFLLYSLNDNVLVPSNVSALVCELKRRNSKPAVYYNQWCGHRWGGVNNLFLKSFMVRKFLNGACP